MKAKNTYITILIAASLLTTGCGTGMLLSDKYQAPVIVKPGKDGLFQKADIGCREKAEKGANSTYVAKNIYIKCLRQYSIKNNNAWELIR